MSGLYSYKERNRVYFGMTIWSYIKSNVRTHVLLLLCSVIHIIVLFIYGNETEPVLYATVLYLLLLIFLEIWNYAKEKKKWKLLKNYDFQADKKLQEQLPVKHPIESEYQNIIQKLETALKNEEAGFRQLERENSDFYTMWVHQIKTPIAALRVLMQTAPEDISRMKGELFKIERYVDVILNYLRMGNIHQDLLWKHYSLNDLVRQAVKKYSPLFIQSRLSLKLEGLEMQVLTDEKWLVFVLEQLLSNAIKYTKSGGIRIWAEQTEEVGKKRTILVIEDTGMGIAPEDLPRIFDRAFTGYNGRREKRASGLGLYLCKSVLERLGHEIVITSVVGEGTKVSLLLYEDRSFSGNLTKV